MYGVHITRRDGSSHVINNIIIRKRISRAPIYHTRWQHRALYNNTNHTHTHTASDEGMGRAVKNNLEIIITHGSFKRGGRIRVAECLRQIVPNRWASVSVYSRGDKGSCVGGGS